MPSKNQTRLATLARIERRLPKRYADCENSGDVLDLYLSEMSVAERAAFDARMADLERRTLDYDLRNTPEHLAKVARWSAEAVISGGNPKQPPDDDPSELSRFELIERVAREGNLQITDIRSNEHGKFAR